MRKPFPRRATRLLALLLLPAALILPLLRSVDADAAKLRFADGAFERVWSRTDAPVAENQAVRSWYWGPRPGMIVREAFDGLPGGSHLVQYFDKSRMEINDPKGDQSSKWYVTNGLLTVELISGQMQVGTNKYEKRQPADIPLAADTDDANAPTYASFGAVSNGPNGDHPAADRKGQDVVATIDRAGKVGQDASKAAAATRSAYFAPETRHNIPQVFWDFLNSSGPVRLNGSNQTQQLSDPWTFTTGLPISEPYWTKGKIAGKQEAVLVQAFERRVLTYIPSAEKQWQVQMGNIGQHYYQWRYGPAPTLLANSLLKMSNTASYHFSSIMALQNGRVSLPFARQEGDFAAPNKTRVQQQSLDGTTDLITIGASGYVSNTQTNHTWARIDTNDMGSNSSAVDLAALVGVLQYATDVKQGGDENIDGTMCYHLQMTLDPATVPAAAGLTYSAATADLWIAKDTALFKRLIGNLTLASSSAQQGNVVVTVNFGNYGAPVNIQAPL